MDSRITGADLASPSTYVAIHTRREAEDEARRLEYRIKTLQIEEEKAARRIAIMKQRASEAQNLRTDRSVLLSTLNQERSYYMSTNFGDSVRSFGGLRSMRAFELSLPKPRQPWEPSLQMRRTHVHTLKSHEDDEVAAARAALQQSMGLQGAQGRATTAALRAARQQKDAEFLYRAVSSRAAVLEGLEAGRAKQESFARTRRMSVQIDNKQIATAALDAAAAAKSRAAALSRQMRELEERVRASREEEASVAEELSVYAPSVSPMRPSSQAGMRTKGSPSPSPSGRRRYSRLGQTGGSSFSLTGSARPRTVSSGPALGRGNDGMARSPIVIKTGNNGS